MRIFLQTENKRLESALKKYGQVVSIPKLQNVSRPVCGHWDLQCFAFDDKTVVTCPEVFCFYKQKLPEYTVLCGDKNPAASYKNEVLYNAALIGKNLFCNIKYTDPVILSQAQKRKIKINHVKQGYATCSTIKIAENALLTSDPSIYRAAIAAGLDVLLTNNNGVLLPGYPTGFLGGACICLKDKLLFCGDITRHTDYSQICAFAAKYEKTVLSISDFPLSDLGSPHIF